ncbi:hypothetical protein LCGC14_0316760 [marine sediment metagenome]|uniref:Uncharacterized protein n=1 Tax=marine sediment metagenome TaxID=412755 RepID=A0A0F9TR17_9ZZZZ
MRTAKIGNIKVTLNERDYKQLLKRFDTSKVVSRGNYTRTDGECICEWYPDDCTSCPLATSTGCTRLLYYCTGANFHEFDIMDEGMEWHKNSDAKARAQLDTIHDFLLRIPKTRR